MDGGVEQSFVRIASKDKKLLQEICMVHRHVEFLMKNASSRILYLCIAILLLN
jgi:hypothetical protein